MPEDAPHSPPPAAPGQWLLCVASMPAEDPAARMRVLRTLEALGATVLREGERLQALLAILVLLVLLAAAL